MIRRQLELEDWQDQALKERARELGVSEAEFVRQTLSKALQPSKKKSGKSDEAMDEFFALADKIAKTYRFPEGYRFNRQEHYEEEERRKGLG